MKITIKDIAKSVGVSASTVSRVLNGNTSISEKTKNKVLLKVKELDYHPNNLARNLIRGVTRTIALVIDTEDENSFSNIFFSRSMYAIERNIEVKGYNLLIVNDNKNGSIKNLVYERKVDGLILPSSSANEDLLELLNKEKVPYVFLGEPRIKNIDSTWVDINNYEGSKDAVNHLLDNGYQKINFIVENNSTIFSEKRIKGFHDALIYKHRTATIKDIIKFKQNDTALTDKILKAIKIRKVDGFICSNNIIAYNLMKILKLNNISIPKEVGIVTFDNYPLSEYMDPPLTAIDVDTYKLGEETAKKLLNYLNLIK